jgi:Icc-related predicted phosphoesterase
MKNIPWAAMLWAATLSSAMVACTEKKPAPAKMLKPTVSLSKPSETAKPAAASGPGCVGLWSTKASPKSFEAGGFTMTRQGSKLMAASAHADDKFVFGVIADIKENTPENLANLKHILAHFLEQKVEAIVVPGDIGDTQAQIEEVLDVLSAANIPILTIIGNREGRAAYSQALRAANKRYPQILDLNQLRLVILDGLAFISIPGYHNKIYIHARDGCHYTPEDVEATKVIAKAAEGKTRFLVSHGPPRQIGAVALDRTLEQANVGDPELQNFLQETEIRFGIFANIHEAGGRATDRSGEKLIGPDNFVESLYMNPGPADAVRWAMNDGTESVGMAAVITVKGEQAKYSIFRLTPAN